jgi:NAD(P)-dependent dehydrogenase (short-subunit alcohol dehydrogenase family)
MKLMLITGANGQIGSSLAKSYREEGYELALFYHNRTDRLDSFPVESMFKVNLVNYTDVKQALGQVVSQYHKTPDCLIHCAALRSADALPLANTEPAVFEEVFRSNFSSAYNILRAVLPGMQENGFGRVVMFGSEVSRSGLKNGSAYAAAKAGIVSLVKSSAKEMAAYNVLINAVSPAPVDTVLEEDFQGEYLEFRKAYFANHVLSTPSGKLVSINEIKKVIDLLTADELCNLSGEEIFITGGI